MHYKIAITKPYEDMIHAAQQHRAYAFEVERILRHGFTLLSLDLLHGEPVTYRNDAEVISVDLESALRVIDHGKLAFADRQPNVLTRLLHYATRSHIEFQTSDQLDHDIREISANISVLPASIIRGSIAIIAETLAQEKEGRILYVGNRHMSYDHIPN